jgi:hypothetical protein
MVESTAADSPDDECGVVNIEGLTYRIRHAKRVRQRVGFCGPGVKIYVGGWLVWVGLAPVASGVK